MARNSKQSPEEPVKLDWGFKAFLNACVEAPPNKAAASIRVNKHAKRVAKAQKKQLKRNKRHTVACGVALATNQSIKSLIDKS